MRIPETSNAVEVFSRLQRPEWGGDGEVYVDLQIGTDNLRVETFLAGIILEDKGFGEPTVGFEFHHMDVWLNGTELTKPYIEVANTVNYIEKFVGGTREYNDFYDDLKEHHYLLYNLEHEIIGKSSLADLEESLSQSIAAETALANKNNARGQNEKEIESMSKYDISAKVNPLKDQSGKVKAMASVSIDSVIAINSLTIVEGSNGNFVGYPQSKDKDGNFRDIVEFMKDENGKMTQAAADLKTEINKLLTGMHKDGVKETPEKAEHEKVPVMHEIKAFVTPLRESENATKGLATVQIGEMFKINSVRVNENMKEGSDNFGKNFVAMPSRQDKTSESGYRDVVHPVNKEYGEALRGTVLKQYDNQLAWKNHMANKDKAQTAQRDKPATNKSNPDLG